MLNQKIKRIIKISFRVICCLSLAFNLVLLLFVLAVNNDYIAIPKLSRDIPEYAAACVVTAPAREDLSSFISFGPLRISARTGDLLGIQISAYMGKQQSFTRLRYVYDKSILDVRNDSRRTLIKALSPGESFLEAVDVSGERIPIAYITVQ